MTRARDDGASGNATRAALAEWRRDVGRLGTPTDHDEWDQTPQTIDAAVNCGAIGAAIGHEVGRGFDDQGSISDAHGVLHQRSNERDRAAFHKLAARLAEQYAALAPARHPDRRSPRARQAPCAGARGTDRGAAILPRLRPSPAAPVSRREPSNLVLSGPNRPGPYRVTGVLRDVDAWSRACGATPADALYLLAAERVHRS